MFNPKGTPTHGVQRQLKSKYIHNYHVNLLHYRGVGWGEGMLKEKIHHSVSRFMTLLRKRCCHTTFHAKVVSVFAVLKLN